MTALLQSRTVDVDLHVGNQEKKSEVIPLKGLFFLDRKEFPSTPVKDEGLESHHVSTANVSSDVGKFTYIFIFILDLLTTNILLELLFSSFIKNMRVCIFYLENIFMCKQP